MEIDSSRIPVGQKITLPGHFDHDVTLEGARPLGKPRAYLVFGIEDKTHAVCGTRFDPAAEKAKVNRWGSMQQSLTPTA